MREDDSNPYGEVRDSLDRRWYDFLHKCNLIPLLIPNNIKFQDYVKELTNINGVIFTGGNTLSSLGGSKTERDDVEKELLQYTLKENIPVIGVCRGMQLIQNYFKIKLLKVAGHVRTRHNLSYNGDVINVNSFHDFGAYETAKELATISTADDGVIEALCHRELPVLGIMWHPEREKDFSSHDITIFKSHFNAEIHS